MLVEWGTAKNRLRAITGPSATGSTGRQSEDHEASPTSPPSQTDHAGRVCAGQRHPIQRGAAPMLVAGRNQVLVDEPHVAPLSADEPPRHLRSPLWCSLRNLCFSWRARYQGLPPAVKPPRKDVSMCEGRAHVGSGVTRPRGDRVDSLMTRIRCQVGAAGDRNDVAGVNSCAVPFGMRRMNIRSKIIMIASASSAGGDRDRPDHTPAWTSAPRSCDTPLAGSAPSGTDSTGPSD